MVTMDMFGSNAERQSGDCDGGEATMLDEAVKAVTNVFQQVVHAIHSYLSASSGSTFVARRAGM